MQAHVDVDRDPAAALVIRTDATNRELSTVTCAAPYRRGMRRPHPLPPPPTPDSPRAHQLLGLDFH